MNRFATLAAGVALLFSTGCKTDGEWSVRKALGWDAPPPSARVVQPTAKDVRKLPAAKTEVAERVDTVGRNIILKSTFTGLEPDMLFMTAGIKEPVLFHGNGFVFVSEGLVEKCQSDSQLAALLCSELGTMMAEQRAARAVGRETAPVPDVTTGGNPMMGGGTAFDAGRQVELARHEQQFPRDRSRIEAADANANARELLRSAGYSAGELDVVEGLVKQSDRRGDSVRKLMSPTAPAPKWEK